MASYGTSTTCGTAAGTFYRFIAGRLKAAKKQLRRGLSSPQKVIARITESLNNIATTECHAIRSATLSVVIFLHSFRYDFVYTVMATSRPVKIP